MNHRNWMVLAAFALMVMPAGAQNMQPGTMASSSGQVDYTTLLRPRIDYLDIVKAHSEGFNYRQIAMIWKMSDESGQPFDIIVDQAAGGQSFPTLADQYDLNLKDIRDCDDYLSRIRSYRTAYMNTGSGAARSLVAGSRMTYMSLSGTPMTADMDIRETIFAFPELSTLARAVSAANMNDVFSGPGPLTIFAPINTAFDRLPQGQLDSLMSDSVRLTRLLRYHIIPSTIDAADAMAMTTPTSPPTLDGEPLQITSTTGTVFVNGASVVRPDILCTNGVIHEVDAVLMPPGFDMPAGAIAPGTMMITPNTMTPNTTPPTGPPTPDTMPPSGTTTTPNTMTPPNGTTTTPNAMTPNTTPPTGTPTPDTTPSSPTGQP